MIMNQLVQHEQRQFMRIPAVLYFSLEIEGRLYFGNTGNLSLGGVYLDTCSPKIPDGALGKKGVIRIAIGAKTVELACDIAYSKGTPMVDGVGLRFHRAEAKHYEILEQYIQDHS